MAEGKKSFIAYSDWKNIFDELPNEEAGQLIKHIFAYVNDENPKTDSVLINAVFAPIKSSLKRDLVKYEGKKKQWSEAGKASAEAKRLLKESNNRSTESTDVNNRSTESTVSDSVSDSVSVKENKKNNIDSRKLKFASTLEPFLEIYGKETLNEFYFYWIEPNRSKTKMRFELEKTWDTSLRLKKWASNNFNKKNNGKKTTIDALKQFIG